MQTSHGPLQAGSQPKGVSKPKPIEKVVVPVRGTGNHLQSRMHGGASSIKISIAQCGEQFELSCSDCIILAFPHGILNGNGVVGGAAFNLQYDFTTIS